MQFRKKKKICLIDACYQCFVDCCFSFCLFSLGHCFVCPSFDLRLLITPLISSNFLYHNGQCIVSKDV